MKIFLMPSSGGEPRALTAEDRDQGIASWSPDGAQLVFGDVPPKFGVPVGGEAFRPYPAAKAFGRADGHLMVATSPH